MINLKQFKVLNPVNKFLIKSPILKDRKSRKSAAYHVSKAGKPLTTYDLKRWQKAYGIKDEDLDREVRDNFLKRKIKVQGYYQAFKWGEIHYYNPDGEEIE